MDVTVYFVQVMELTSFGIKLIIIKLNEYFLFYNFFLIVNYSFNKSGK